MPSPKLVRDESLAVPPGLDEAEQYSAMMQAEKLGMRRPTDDLIALPLGTAPPGGGWRRKDNVAAPMTGKVYTIYILSHDPPKRGPTGTKSKPPAKHPGVNSKTHHQKPHAPTGSSDSSSPYKLAKKKKEKWLGTINSDHLTESIEAVRKVLDDQAATEEQITAKVQEGIKQARTVALTSDDDPRVGMMTQELAEAADRIGDMRNKECEKLLEQEDRSPGSVKDAQIEHQVKRVLEAERQRQLIGAADPNGKAMTLVVKAIGIVGDRKADAVQKLLDQDKRSPGSITEPEFNKAIVELLGMARQTELLGIQRPKTAKAMESVAEVVKVLIKRKADVRRKLIQRQKDDPNSGVTDKDIQEATMDLNKMKEQARSLGMQGEE